MRTAFREAQEAGAPTERNCPFRRQPSECFAGAPGKGTALPAPAIRLMIGYNDKRVCPPMLAHLTKDRIIRWRCIRNGGLEYETEH